MIGNNSYEVPFTLTYRSPFLLKMLEIDLVSGNRARAQEWLTSGNYTHVKGADCQSCGGWTLIRKDENAIMHQHHTGCRLLGDLKKEAKPKAKAKGSGR